MFVLQLENAICILTPFDAANVSLELFLCLLFQYASKCFFLFSYLIVISYFSLLLFFSPTHHPVSLCDAGEERGQSG